MRGLAASHPCTDRPAQAKHAGLGELAPARADSVAAMVTARFLSQDDRIEIADGLARGEPVKLIAARIGRSYQTVYREIARNSKPGGR